MSAFSNLLDRRIAASSRGPVRSAEFRRIEDLPRKKDEPPDSRVLELLRADNPSGKFLKVLPSQFRALSEISRSDGFVGLMGVGSGKTLVTILAAGLFDCARPVLVVPAALKKRTLDEIEEIKRAWIVHYGLRVVSWEELSQAKNKDLLDELDPDLLVFDEAHKLKNKKSARGGRIYRRLKKSPCPVIAVSGTLARKSVADVAWIFEAALGEGSPLPRTFSDTEDWAAATDDKPLVRYKPGALSRLMNPGETPREAVWRRVAETEGVLRAAVAEEDLPSLTISRVDAKPPEEIILALNRLEREWELPGGLMISDPMAVWRAARQLSLGFYYEPLWDRGVSLEARAEWVAARKEWAAFVRQHSKSARHDSEALVASACRAGDLPTDEYTKWTTAFEKIKSPVRVPRFLRSFSEIEHVAGKWFSNPASLLWVESIAIGEALSRSTGVPYFGAGSTEKDVLSVDAAICSIGVCGTGMNLQKKFSRNLVLEPPSSGLDWEQLLGRTHRIGQPEDEVSCEVLVWTPPLRAAWDSAVENARFQEVSSGNRQKLLLATKTGF